MFHQNYIYMAFYKLSQLPIFEYFYFYNVNGDGFNEERFNKTSYAKLVLLLYCKILIT